MTITDKAQIKVAELKESNNLRLSESDELECYELIESDLKLPADAAFARSSVAYLSDGTQVATNTPRFEQGRFGKAIMVEEGTENLENPDNLTAWSGTSGERVVTRIGQYKFNVKFYNQTGGSFLYESFALTVGNYYTLSAYVKGIGNTIGKQVRLQSMSENAYGDPVTLTAEYQKISVTLQATTTSRAIGFIGVPDNTFVADDEIEIAFVLFEQKPYATSFTDGTRAAETLELPTEGVLNPQEGTIEVTYIPSLDSSKVALGSAGQDWWWILGTGSAPNINELRLAYANGSWHFQVGGGSDTTYSMSFAAGDKISLALTWKQGVDARFFINGVKVATFTPSNFDVGTVISIGYSHLWNSYRCNGLIDDLRISSCARSDEEILAAYQSRQPLLVDEWTTYKLDFDDKVRITTQGQLICNELIEI